MRAPAPLLLPAGAESAGTKVEVPSLPVTCTQSRNWLLVKSTSWPLTMMSRTGTAKAMVSRMVRVFEVMFAVRDGEDAADLEASCRPCRW